MSRIDDVVNRWLGRLPGARDAYYQDPAYHAQIQFMHRMFTVVDIAMQDEGIPEETRMRVLLTAMYGAPDETQALARVADRKTQADLLANQPLLVPKEWRP